MYETISDMMRKGDREEDQKDVDASPFTLKSTGIPFMIPPMLLRVKRGPTLLPSQTLELIAGHLF